MNKFIQLEPVTFGPQSPYPQTGLCIDEIAIDNLWLLQSNRQARLNDLSQELFGDDIQQGGGLNNNNHRLLHFSPCLSLLFSSQESAINGFETIATDLSHGYCELRLSGVSALDFINIYTSVDMKGSKKLSVKQARCRLGQYVAIFWWDKPERIHLLIERSLAQSFRDYLAHLMARWN